MAGKRSIAVATVARSDFGLYEPLLERMRASESVDLRLMVSGAHFAKEFGPTVREIESKGYEFERGLEMRLDSDSPQGVAKAIGGGIQSFAQAFALRRPDMAMVLGDRIEMLCCAVAAVPFNIPLVHLYGGKVSEGASDELIRHALTKMSHLHFVTTQTHADRVLQMGEEAWRVFNCGSAGLDRIHLYERASRQEICETLNLDPARPFLLVTFHPVTLESAGRAAQIGGLTGALAGYDGQIVITYPNADPGYSDIVDAFEAFAVERKKSVRLIRSAGSRMYFDLMAHAAAMVGNSSSGIGEAPSFELPVVNIGSRQDGFARASNVIDCGYSSAEISQAIQHAVSHAFRTGLHGLRNPYGDGRSSELILETLLSVELDDRLLRKRFVGAPVRL